MTPSRSTRTFKSSERGASLVEYALLIALIAVAVIGVVTFVGDDNKDKESSGPPTAHTASVIYQGKVLNCIDFNKTEDVGGKSISCNFEDFYANPQVPKPGSKLPKAQVRRVIYQGETLHCVQFSREDAHLVRSASCDFIRYYNDLES